MGFDLLVGQADDVGLSPVSAGVTEVFELLAGDEEAAAWDEGLVVDKDAA